MNRFELAKIVQWPGTFRSRKRMQKLIFLLQAAGCPLNAEFSLHHYGPYSQDVARLTDEMVREGLLQEQREVHPYGEQYSYTLSEGSQRQIAEYEASPEGLQSAAQMTRFKSLAGRLYGADLKELEIASTIVFFRKQGHDWATAVDKSCQFKGLIRGCQVVERAEALAGEVVP